MTTPIIVPCCGRSTRYPNTLPKWMMPAADGRPMIAHAVGGLDVDPSDLVVVLLREHDERFGAVAGVRGAMGSEVRAVVLEEPTSSQSETVARALEQLPDVGSFLVKDSDNRFELGDVARVEGYVAVESLASFETINARNKSYVEVDQNGLITNIREKEVISDLFSVGGYHFPSAERFMDHYDRLRSSDIEREIFLSDVIAAMILEGVPFVARRVTGYQDWGTVHEWRRALLERRTLLVSLDGFVFERGSRHFVPRFEDVRPNTGAIDALRHAVERGNTIVYLSIRPEYLRSLTERQLLEAGAPDAPVLFGCPLTSWTVVTAPDPSLPFTTSHATEVAPDDANLTEKVLDEW